MKKLFLVITLLSLFIVCGCNNNDNPQTNQNITNNNVSSTTINKDKDSTTIIDTISDTTTEYDSPISNIQTYTVSFDSDGGTEIKSQLIEKGSNVSKPADPIKKGYAFDGWYIGDVRWNFNGFVVSEDITLKAKWNIYQYNLIIKYNDNVSDDTILTYDYRQSINQIDNPIRIGYTFDKWDKTIPSTMPAEDVVINALWSINQYTLTIKYNDNVTEDLVLTYDYNQTIDNIDNPTRTEYTFDKWDKTIPSNMPAEDVIINALWNINTYNINYHLDNGTNNNLNPNTYTVEDNIELLPPSKTGYQFAGWYKDSNYNTLITNIDKGTTNDLDLYAKYTVNTYAIHYDTNGGDILDNNTQEVTYDDNYSLSIPSRTGYTFIGWEYNNQVIDNSGIYKYDRDIIVLARWNINQYTLTLKNYYGDTDLVLTQDYNTVINIDNPTRTGYTFNSYSEPIPTIMLDENKTIEVLWNINQYTLTIKYNDNVTEDTVLTYDYNQTIASLDNPIRIGYTFNKWDKTIPSFMPAEDIELNALWKANSNTKYLVNHYQQNIDNDEYTLFETVELYGTTDSIVEAPINLYNGFTSPDKKTTTINPDGSAVVDYYYTRNLYSITIIGNNGSVYEYNNKKYGTSIDLDSITRTNYTFGGLYRDIDLSNKFNDTTIPYEDLTLYVWWKEETKPSIFTYEIANNQVNLNKCKDTLIDNVVIPSYIGGKEVKTIGVGAFYGCSSLESITLPFVGDKEHTPSDNYQYPFGYIFGTNSYTGSTATKQYYYGSSTSSTINTTYYIPSSLKNVTITGSTYISHNAFYNCSSLTSITISNSVTSIGSSAFWNCSSLTSITIPFVGDREHISTDTYRYPFGYIFGTNSYTGGIATEQYYDYYYGSSKHSTSSTYYIPSSLKNVTITGSSYIPYGAFYNCSSLTSITIPDSVTSIENYAFQYCSSLNKVNISNIESWHNISFGSPSSNPLYYAHNLYLNDELVTDLVITNTITSIKQYAFYNCSSLTSITIPNSVASIGERAFYYCSSLKSITIPDIVTSIEERAFEGCSSLTSITIPDSVTSIGKGAFRGCSSLKSITIPDSVTSIGQYAFYNCSSLTSITIPKSVASIGIQAFSGCSSIESIAVDSNNSLYDSRDNCNAIIDTGTNTLIVGCKNAIIPFSVTTIGDYAFNNCSSLTSIIIPNSVTSIGSHAFSGCSSLESIALPFVGNKEHSRNETYQYPFGYIFGSSSYTGGVSTTQYYYGSSTSSSTSTKYYIPSSLKDVTITGSSYIPYGAFYGCSSLTSITIPDSVTSIGNGAFFGCSSLESITLPFVGYEECAPNDRYQYPFGYIFGTSSYTGGVAITQSYYGSSTSSTTSTTYYIPLLLKDVTITGSSYIPRGAFYNCSSLTSITIPNSIRSIESYAFYNCSSLTSITIPDTVTSIGSNAFDDCSSLKKVNISSIESWCNISFSSFDSNPLYYAHNLYLNDELVTNLVIPDSVTLIKKYAFSNCSSLTSIAIPSGVSSIGDYAFSGCSSLESIVVDLNNSIYDSRNDCNAIIETKTNRLTTGCNNTIIPDTVKSIREYAFYNCSSLTSITIPNGVTSIENYTYYNCSSLQSITIPESVTSIGSYAFEGCSSLNKVNISSIESWCNISLSSTNSNPLSYAHNLYLNDELVMNLIIPDSVTLIKKYAFYNCSSLASITIPNGVTSIENYAFYNCLSLTSIIIPNSVTTIEKEVFSGCFIETAIIPAFAASYIKNSKLKEVVITSGTSIEDLAFYNCSSLESIIIPENVTSIGSYAFYNCSSLTSITIPNNITLIKNGAFSGCSSLTIYCETTSKPSGWNSNWNPDNRPVVWNYKD